MVEVSHIVAYVTLIALAFLITVGIFDTWQTFLLLSFFSIVISYIVILSIDNLTVLNINSVAKGFLTEGFLTEGFEDKTISKAEESKYEWLSNDDLFDDFYASVFTKLTQNENLVQAETAVCLEEFSKGVLKEHLSILDAGCGIGVGTCSLISQGVGNAVGIDKSQAMCRFAKNVTLKSSTLNDLQKQDIEFRQFDLIGPGAAAAAEFTDAMLLYFTVYYFKDLDVLFRNLALWVKPGGHLAVEVVNKYKFEPVLNSSNPLVGVTPQNYVKERITKSKVVFDKFDYEADFDLDDPRAEFRETFRFKDGSVRRQKHVLHMYGINEIVAKAQENGWEYTKYMDLMPLSFPYGYLLFFTRQA
jgi:SAM-dependent methyltransferase